MTDHLWQERLRPLISAQKPLIAIVGPTAGGKTGLSLRVAHWLQGIGASPEIINADSRQFYRDLDIGTAKIRPEDMEGVPHHLLSVLDPMAPVSIAWFQEQAAHVIAQIHARGGMPILVGGSMLYVSSIVDGLRPIGGDEAIRARLSDAYDADDGVSLQALLREVDPVSAALIPRENKVYLIRALEIFELTGQPKSVALHSADHSYDLVMLGIAPPRDEILRNIHRRIDAMFDDGWIHEVRQLMASGVSPDAPALMSHGYREIVAWIQAGERAEELPMLKQTIAQKTAQYAKRQMTWWRPDERILWCAS